MVIEIAVKQFSPKASRKRDDCRKSPTPLIHNPLPLKNLCLALYGLLLLVLVLVLVLIALLLLLLLLLPPEVHHGQVRHHGIAGSLVGAVYKYDLVILQLVYV